MLAANRPLRLTLYALLAAILYLPGLGRPALWEPDEGRYAEIAREMFVSGDYVTPRDDFELYFEKPPLVYWADAASIGIFGVNEFAVRLPAALFSVGQVVVTAALAEEMFGATAGFFAALVLALSPLFFGFARFATLDPALAFFLTAALGAFYLAPRDESFSRPSARRWMLIAAAMLALGTLAKGPVSLLLGGAIPLIWLAFERRLSEIRAMPLAPCLLIYALIVVPWFVLIESRNPGFLSFFFVHEHLQRYVTSSEHGWGPWFFVPIVIGGAWPWIFFLPLGWSAMRTRDPSSDSAARRSAASFLAIWFVVIFVFFSIPRSKLGSYILPAMPPLAIVAGYGLARLSTLDLSRRRRLLAVVAIASVVLAAGLLVFFEFALAPVNHALGLDGVLIALALASGPIAMYWLPREPARIPYAIAALAIAMLATVPLAARARRDASPLSHLSRPCNRCSALPRRQLYARLLPPLRAIASVLHAPTRDPRRILGRAVRSCTARARQVAVHPRLRDAPERGVVFRLMHGSDREPTRPQGARGFAQARAGDPRMRGQEVRALQRHARAASRRSILSRVAIW